MPIIDPDTGFPGGLPQPVGPNLYSVGVFTGGGVFLANELLFSHTFEVPVSFPMNFEGSQSRAAAMSSATTSLLIKKMGVQVGTLVFNAGNPVGSFVTVDDVSFDEGEEIELYAPAIADTTLALVNVTFAGSVS